MRNTYASNAALEVEKSSPSLEIKVEGGAPVYPDTPIRLSVTARKPRESRLVLDSRTKLIGASVAARRLGVPIDRVTADIKAGMLNGLGTADPFALTGGLLPLGYFVEAWELEGERLAYHQKRLSRGSAGSRE